MKKLIIIFSVLFLAAVPLMAAEKTAQENTGTEQQSSDRDTDRPNAGIIKEISIESVTIGSNVYPFSEDIAYFSNNGDRITRVDFSQRDGVLFKLNKDGKVYYMKKIPR